MRRLLLALAVVLAVQLPGTPARAHNQLVTAAPTRDGVTLTFLQRLKPEFTTIVVSDAARQRVAASAPTVDGATGTVTFSRPLDDGAYVVAYRVVSVDGHTAQGSYNFTLTDGAASVVASPAASPAAPGTGGVPGGVLVALVTAVPLIGLLGYAASRRRSRRLPAGNSRSSISPGT